MTVIQVATGRLLDVASLKSWEVELEDIATALSNLCRFTGHVREFYSVAQHCFEVSRLAEVLAQKSLNQNIPNWATFVGKRGLLHDAHEAYIGDVATPIKSVMCDGFEFEDMVDGIDEAIFKRFGVNATACGLRDVIDTADERMLATEKRDVLTRSDLPWSYPKLGPIDRVIVPVGPKEAKRLFVERFNELWAEGKA